MFSGRMYLLVLLAALVAGVQGEDAHLFGDFLDKPQAGTQSTSPSGYYQAVETQSTCLREALYKNCRGITTDGTISYWESSLTCCKSGPPGTRPTGPADSFFDDVEIGACSFVDMFFDDYVQVSSTAFKAGTFEVSCTLKSASPLCGAPFCEGMSISAKGFIYLTLDVVSYTNPVPTSPDPVTCGGLIPRLGATNGKERPQPPKRNPAMPPRIKAHKAMGRANAATAADAAKPATKATTKASIQQADTAGYSHSAPTPRTMYQSAAWIWSGPMEVHSRMFDIKLEGSSFEYVGYWYNDVAETIDEDLSTDKYLVDPYTYTLKFTKPSSHGGYDAPHGSGGYEAPHSGGGYEAPRSSYDGPRSGSHRSGGSGY